MSRLQTRSLAGRVRRLEAALASRALPDSSVLARLQQNPTLPLLGAGMNPDPWQAKLLHSTADRILLLCSRQAGKSTAAAALALQVALLTPRSLVLVFSPSLRQSGELLRKVLDLFNALKRPVAVVAETSSRLELANGSRILSLPGGEDTVRGYSGVSLLIIDEAARVPDALYRSVRPMLAVSQGRLIALSTPFGKRGWFYQEWQGTENWERYRVPAVEVPRIRKDYLDRERVALGDAWFRQEYCCDFTMMAGLVYPEFPDCITDVGELPILDRSYAGVDFGFHNPSAVVFGVLDNDDVLWIVDEIYRARMTDDELIRKIWPLSEKYQTDRFWCDPSAPQSIEKMRRADLRASPAVNNLNPGIRAVAARIRTGRLRVSRRCRKLIAEAELYHCPEDDETTAQRKDQPIKENDHALDALRYLICGMDRVRGVDDWQRDIPQCEERPSTGVFKLSDPSLPESWRQVPQEPEQPDWMDDRGWEPAV
jgi:hypothetical protein